MLQRNSKTLWGITILFVALLAGCLTPVSSPVAASWPDQLAAVERSIPNMSDDFVPVDAAALPVCESGGTDKPIELAVTLILQDQKSSQLDTHGTSLYATRDVQYNDHRLGTTLKVQDEYLIERHLVDPASFERAHSIRFSAHDVLLLTLEEGQAYIGKPVDCGNIDIHLLGMWVTSSDEAQALWAILTELNAHAMWEIRSYGANAVLSFLVDANTGAILRRWEELAGRTIRRKFSVAH